MLHILAPPHAKRLAVLRQRPHRRVQQRVHAQGDEVAEPAQQA